MTRVILSGATGKVGQALMTSIEAEADLTLAAAAAPSLGLGLAEAIAAGDGDVVVDFTAPAFAADA
ncbi:MAG: Dihydrodipicolinate reductase, N-terminus, partial [Gaiellales bacterium]|nr:Dihydrodipicolinate reductase, N-terminus [Gaiellales bacterium]